MIEFFKTLSSYWDKLVSAFDIVFTNIKSGITEIKYWIDFLPATLLAAALIIIVILVIYKVLGR